MKKKKKKVVQDLPVEEAAPSPSSAAAAAEPTTESAPAAAASSANDDSAAASSAPPADAAVEGDGAEMFADLKKKKKKKKEMPADIDLTSSDLPTASAEGLTKKKKSKKTATDFAKELDDLDAERQDQVADELDREIGEDPFEGGEGDADDGDDDGEDVDAWVKEGRVATYPELLRRFFSQLHAHNPELAGEKRRYTMVPPQVTREGTKKTMFANITDICRRMRRQPEHVIQFLYSELGTQGSIDGSQRLIMKGRYNNKQIENVLRKYIIEYVTCKICKSSDTLLGKENRLFFVTCESCGSRNSVSTIKAGFQAQVGRRVKAA